MKKGTTTSVLPFGCRTAEPLRTAKQTDIAAARTAGASPGFTLLELLTSMAILLLIAAMLFTAFNQASRAWLQAENRVETFTQARAALDLISRDLSQAMATTNISFLGNTNQVAFVASASVDTNDIVDLLEVVYQVNSGGYLERRVDGYVDGADWNFYSLPQEWPVTTSIITTVADNIVSLRFDYIGTDSVSRVFWNSTPALAPAWAGTVLSATTIPTPEVMTNRTPAGVQITIRAIDGRTAGRLQPGMSAAISNNIINPARQTFSTFIAIPNRQP